MDERTHVGFPQDIKVAVSGHSGFIGTCLLERFSETEATAVVIEGDVTREATWDCEFDLLYHLAGYGGGNFAADPGRGFDVNVSGTVRALEACRRNGADLVFPSTCGVYDPSMLGALSERSPTAPPTPYGHSKLACEVLCEAYAKHFSVNCRVLRLFNVYGEGQGHRFFIPYLVACARAGREAEVRTPESVRDFVHVTDVVSAMLTAGRSAPGFGVYNIGEGAGRSVQEVIETIGRLCEKGICWRTLESGQDCHPAAFADIGKAREELSWMPSVAFDQGLLSMLTADEQQGNQPDS